MERWFYLDNGDRRGPVDRESLLTLVLKASDPRKVRVWREGLASWQDAGAIPELSAGIPPDLPSISPREAGLPSVAFNEANAVVRLYRRLLLLVGMQFIIGLMTNVITSDALLVTSLIVLVGVFVGSIVTAYKLDRRLGSRRRLRAFAMCIPFVNLAVLSGISRDSQAWCKQYGIQVGFFGPTKQSLEKLRRADF